MTASKNPVRHRLSLLLIMAVMVAVALIGPHQRFASASCVPGAFARYFSDATYTTQVGLCHHNCCELWTCTGEMTQYEVDMFFDCSGE